MSIDLRSETLFPLNQLPERYPLAGRGGKKLHPSTGFRWAQHGVRGVRLEFARCGGTLYTSDEAVARWVERLTEGAEPPAAPVSATRANTPVRRRELDRVDRELDRLGV
jgi:hypothetical protein